MPGLKKRKGFFGKTAVLAGIYFKVARSILSGLPYKLTLVITNQCNSRCKICLAWKNEIPVSMKLSDIKAAIVSFPGQLAWLHITGGEPFIHPEISEILSFVGSLNSSMLVSISSNGLEEEKIRSLLSRLALENRNKIFYLNLSLDGNQKEHDFLRGAAGGFAKTSRLLGYFGELSERCPLFTVGINSTISRFNIDSFYDFYSEASGKLKHINVNLAEFSSSCYRNSPDLSFEAADKPKLRVLLEGLAKTLPWYPAESFIKKLYLKSMIRESRGIPCPVPCSSYRDNILLFGDGTASPCFKLSHQKIPVRPPDLRKISGACRALMENGNGLRACGGSCVLSCEKYLHIINSIVKLKINKILPLLFS